MAESQSRYGIMEELTNRKIREKEKLANIERDTDNKIYELENDITKIKQMITNKKGSYKLSHRDTVRQLKVALTMKTSEYNRNKEKLENAIAEEDSTFESNFQDWNQEKLSTIKDKDENLARYTLNQEKKIKEKKCVIEEIENGISSLKELSKEQGKAEA